MVVTGIINYLKSKTNILVDEIEFVQPGPIVCQPGKAFCLPGKALCQPGDLVCQPATRCRRLPIKKPPSSTDGGLCNRLAYFNPTIFNGSNDGLCTIIYIHFLENT